MEEWEFEFEWLQVRHKMKAYFGRDQLPDMNGILFMIGIQELGRWEDEFTKEQKQDLMHIAVCRLLEYDGYYEFEGRDADGWPHYKSLKPFTQTGAKTQERFLQEKVIQYFKDLEQDTV